MTHRIRRLSTAAVCALAAVPTTTGWAQDGTSQDAISLEQIIVTARKHEEGLQDVPLSVTALTAESIRQQGINSVRELATQIPGLTFQESFGRRDDRPGIRGLTSIGDPSFGVESGTAIFVDGVFIAADTSSFGLQDLERVEMVRGPQSALYGRNAYSGAINFATRTPGDELGVYGLARAARFDEYDISAGVDGPIVPGTLWGGLYARYYSLGGEFTNSFNDARIGDEETYAIAGNVYFEPVETVRVRGRVAYSEDDDGHIPFTMVLADTDFEGDGIGPFDGDDYFVGDLPGVDNRVVGPLNEDLLFVSGMERETVITTLRADIDVFAGHTLSILGGYHHEDRQTGSDSAPLGPLFSGLSMFPFSDQDLEDWSVELRLESPQDQRIRWLVGLFYYEDDRESFGVSYDNATTRPWSASTWPARRPSKQDWPWKAPRSSRRAASRPWSRASRTGRRRTGRSSAASPPTSPTG